MNPIKKSAVLTLPILVCCFVFLSCKKDKKASENTPANAVTTEAVENHTVEGIATGSFSEPQTVYFSFATNSVVPASQANTTNWDISFRRQIIRLNGGVSGPGNTGVVIRTDDYAMLTLANETGYQMDGTGSADETGTTTDLLPFNSWYDYNQSVVTPKPQFYVIRTAKNKYLKMEILDYYDPVSGNGGVYKFRYVYQPGGSRVLE